MAQKDHEKPNAQNQKEVNEKCPQCGHVTMIHYDWVSG